MQNAQPKIRSPLKSLGSSFSNRQNKDSMIPSVLTALGCMIILYPLLWVVMTSFQVVGPDKVSHFSLDNYINAFTSTRVIEAMKNTVFISVTATFLSCFLGIILAYSSVRTNMPGRRIFEVLNMIPFFLSPLVGAISWVTLAAPRVGMLNSLAESIIGNSSFFNIYSYWGIIWVMFLFHTPYVYVTVSGSLRKMDPSLEEASRICGAGALRTALRITISLAMPSILFVSSLVLIMSAGMFNVPATLGVPVGIHTFATQVYEVVRRFPGDYNMGAALSGQLLVVIIIIIIIQRRFILPRQFTTVSGKAFRPRITEYGKGKYVLLAINSIYFVISVILPLGSLFAVSITPYWLGKLQFSEFTLKHYQEVLSYAITLRAIKNSLIIAPLTATIVVIITTGAAFYIYRSKAKGRALADIITSIPVAVPGIIIGMGTLVGYIKTPLYSTIAIIMLGYIAHSIPQGLKNISAVLLNLHKELDESSRVSGASWLTTMRHINLPLLMPGIYAAWITLFIIFFKELNTSILLVSFGNEVAAQTLYWLLTEKHLAITASYAMIQTGIILLIVVCFRKLLGLGKLEI